VGNGGISQFKSGTGNLDRDIADMVYGNCQVKREVREWEILENPEPWSLYFSLSDSP
jgi:hypothetical protein